MGFELTIPAFGEAKTIHVLDREATVSGNSTTTGINYRISTIKEKSEGKQYGDLGQMTDI